MRAEVHGAAGVHEAPAQPQAAEAGAGWRMRVLTLGIAAVVMLLVGAAGLLWMRHGVAIFFDTVAAGLATCF
ncbi:hypothetical protein [Azorhizobium doebereinerae]|uniref:hypothetical protein n=1 Tax=Azorhizobium doebereinerae TaxID=281091 RepID=UPI0012EB620C|nr:hypothetical protein [Azorhizobium doebereinerae]